MESETSIITIKVTPSTDEGIINYRPTMPIRDCKKLVYKGGVIDKGSSTNNIFYLECDELMNSELQSNDSNYPFLRNAIPLLATADNELVSVTDNHGRNVSAMNNISYISARISPADFTEAILIFEVERMSPYTKSQTRAFVTNRGFIQ